jgi:hypothetical protein
MGIFGAAQAMYSSEPDTATATPAPKPEESPFKRILHTVMRSAAAVQGQEQAKSIQASQQSGASKMSFTVAPNPAGGPPTVSVKNAPLDLMNGTQQQDLNEAYHTPREQVENKIAGTTTPTNAPVTQPEPDRPLEGAAAAIDLNRGYRIPRPWDSDISEKLKSEDGLRQIAEEMGDRDPRGTARQAFKQLQRGVVTPAAVAKRVADFRAARIQRESQDLQSTLEPYATQANRASLAKDREEDNRRQQAKDDAARAETVMKDKLAIIEKTNFATIDPAEWRKTVDDRNTTGVPMTEHEYRYAERKAQQDVNANFEDFIKNSEKYRLGEYDSWNEAKTAFGHKLTPSQEKQGEAAWSSAHKLVTRKAAAESRTARAQVMRMERLSQQIAMATAEKPVAIGRADLDLKPAAEIVALDPVSTKNFDQLLSQKESLLRNEINEYTDDMLIANRQAIAIQKKFADDKQQGGDEEQLAGLLAKIETAKRRMAEKNADLRTIQAKRTERRTGAPVKAQQKVAPVVMSPAAAAFIKKHQ